ncbi:hypothetical protein AVEN_229087-1 [Araneus ventricosus]|uniref:Uncharacterized protein n=1 Tax=Araneus ventricosus TaxID=182803 RepID=A0A4Y2IX14_ARAVE|nr:hypothetical protein AVEN_229087-1 [Araneus ventricosus]
MTPEPAPPSPNSHTEITGEHLILAGFSVPQARIPGGASVEYFHPEAEALLRGHCGLNPLPRAGVPNLFSLEYPLITIFIFAYPLLSYSPSPTICLCKEAFTNIVKGLVDARGRTRRFVVARILTSRTVPTTRTQFTTVSKNSTVSVRRLTSF